MNSHISQFGVGRYKKAHAHGPGAHVIIMSGEGYTLMWPEGEEPQRYEWKEGSMIVPPNLWFHQHFNTGTTPARYLAFKAEGRRRSATRRGCRRRGSRGASAAIRSTTRTNRRGSGNGSPRRSPRAA